ncbi:hypothetical protein JCM3774_004531 [Rhodotorula dairenensis]
MGSRTACQLDLAPLASQFATLKLESAGSPAPWSTATVPDDAPVRLRVLLQALVALSLALDEQASTRPLLHAGLVNARNAQLEQREQVHRLRDDVLAASRAAQLAHTEARRTQRLKSTFRAGADRIVAALDRRTIRALRKGKWRAVEDGSLAAQVDVSALLDDLADRLGLPGIDGETEDLEDGENDPWRKIEEDLLETLAARVLNRASPTRARQLSLPDLDTPVDETEAFAFPLSPSSSAVVDLPEPDAQDIGPPSPLDPDALATAFRPVVHPVVKLLSTRHRQLQHKIDQAEQRFQESVRESTLAVDAHRVAVSRMHRATQKVRNLEGLEQRELEEQERLMEELRDTVVELAKLRRFGVGAADGVVLTPLAGSVKRGTGL